MGEVKEDIGVREEDGEDRVRWRNVDWGPPMIKDQSRRRGKRKTSSAWGECEGVCHGDGYITYVNQTFAMESVLDVFHRFSYYLCCLLIASFKMCRYTCITFGFVQLCIGWKRTKL